jgi:ArsR family transcriptional regulator, arsenate/arsenite/antimonite-responsive transcriptional repressor / arsenate reductase (thioredoxin)
VGWLPIKASREPQPDGTGVWLSEVLMDNPGRLPGHFGLTPSFQSGDIESVGAEVSLRERAWVHAALGDPVRLAIVDALVLGDVSPGEMGRALGLATNLIAHHLKVLDEAGLISRTRSEGDRRRTYLRLRPERLALLRPPGLAEAARVVFVCTHNSARSQLAAALWRVRTGRPVVSAGTAPAARVHPRAVKVAHRHELELDPAGTAHVADVVRGGDLVIAVCDNAYEELARELAGNAWPRLHWSVPDPVPRNTDAAFEAAYTELAGRVERLVPALTVGGGDG